MRTNFFRMECDNCGNHENISLSGDPAKLMPVLRRWIGCQSGDQMPPPDGSDPKRWYDSLTCMTAGERKFEEQRKAEEKITAAADSKRSVLEDKMKRAQEQIKGSAYCKTGPLSKEA